MKLFRNGLGLPLAAFFAAACLAFAFGASWIGVAQAGTLPNESAVQIGPAATPTASVPLSTPTPQANSRLTLQLSGAITGSVQGTAVCSKTSGGVLGQGGLEAGQLVPPSGMLLDGQSLDSLSLYIDVGPSASELTVILDAIQSQTFNTTSWQGTLSGSIDSFSGTLTATGHPTLTITGVATGCK
jgi:hypothetical protein